MAQEQLDMVASRLSQNLTTREISVGKFSVAENFIGNTPTLGKNFSREFSREFPRKFPRKF